QEWLERAQQLEIPVGGILPLPEAPEGVRARGKGNEFHAKPWCGMEWGDKSIAVRQTAAKLAEGLTNGAHLDRRSHRHHTPVAAGARADRPRPARSDVAPCAAQSERAEGASAIPRAPGRPRRRRGTGGRPCLLNPT